MCARGTQSFHHSSPAKIARSITIFAEKNMTCNQSFIFKNFIFQKNLVLSWVSKRSQQNYI